MLPGPVNPLGPCFIPETPVLQDSSLTSVILHMGRLTARLIPQTNKPQSRASNRLVCPYERLRELREFGGVIAPPSVRSAQRQANVNDLYSIHANKASGRVSRPTAGRKGVRGYGCVR